MSESTVLSITLLLKDLKLISTKLYDDDEFRKKIAKELTENGYEGCEKQAENNSSGIVKEDETAKLKKRSRRQLLKKTKLKKRSDADQVKRVLVRAVNSSFVTYVDVGNDDKQSLKEQLDKLLVSPNKNAGNIKSLPTSNLNKISSNFASLAESRSPLDLANADRVGINKGAPQWFVKNLIQRQFQIKWATGNGEPDDFNFNEFCDVERLKADKSRGSRDMVTNGETKHLKYQPRTAHVKVQLYRYCRVRQEKHYTKDELCPPVYVRTKDGWRKWNPITKQFSKFESMRTTFVRHFNWMRKPIRDYISANAVEIIDTDSELHKALRGHTLYLAVVKDTDFRSGHHLQLNEIGETQVYVGKANNGIKGRWLYDPNSHCEMMKRCLDNVQAMTTYDPERLERIQLVDARLLLAKLRREEETMEEKCALFVMKTYGGSNADESLTAEESKHINGKKINGNGNTNIVPFKICSNWKPGNMAYGMNGTLPEIRDIRLCNTRCAGPCD